MTSFENLPLVLSHYNYWQTQGFSNFLVNFKIFRLHSAEAFVMLWAKEALGILNYASLFATTFVKFYIYFPIR
jgi:hypothetical protein